MANPKRHLHKGAKSTGKFRETHERNIINESPIGKVGGTHKGLKLESGHIAIFSYRGKQVHTNTPMVLVLHPNYMGKMHALNLDYIPENVLELLWKLTKETLQGKLERLVKLRLPLLKVDIGNPKSFYHGRLRSFLNSRLGSTSACYRTFDTGGISDLRIVDYRFKDSAFARKVEKKAAEIDEEKFDTPVSPYNK